MPKRGEILKDYLIAISKARLICFICGSTGQAGRWACGDGFDVFIIGDLTSGSKREAKEQHTLLMQLRFGVETFH